MAKNRLDYRLAKKLCRIESEEEFRSLMREVAFEYDQVKIDSKSRERILKVLESRLLKQTR